MKRLKVALAALILPVLGVSPVLFAQPGSGRLHVHFIDVGQADAILVMDDAKRCVILIDAGDTRYPDSAKNFRIYLSRHLPAGAEIRLAIASHPHNDHIGSMQWVLETYRVQTYIDNGQPYPSRIYRDLMAVVRAQRQQHLDYHPYANVPSSKETVCGPDGPMVKVLYPQDGLDPDVCSENANNCSVVMRLSFRKTSFLFPGDAEEAEEEILLKDAAINPQLAATVLKVPHHGSATSSSPAFLKAVSPTWMVISAGQRDVGTNRGYKHPRQSTILNLLAFAGARRDVRTIDVYDAGQRTWRQKRVWGQFYVTARDGTVILSSDGSAISKD